MEHNVLQVGCPAEAGEFNPRRTQMNTLLIKLSLKLQDLMNREEGQDLVEYALLVALVASAAIAMVGKVGTAVALIFSNISTSLA